MHRINNNNSSKLRSSINQLRISTASTFVQTRLQLAESVSASLVDLSGLKLEGIDKETEKVLKEKFIHLQNFYLNDNHISNISLSFLPKTLTTLNLSNNKLLSIPECFSHLPNLSQLILDNNRLRSVSSSIFTELPNLKRLDLRFNLLSTLPYQAITKMNTFAFLGLSGNRLFRAELNKDFRWPADNDLELRFALESIRKCNWTIERLLWVAFLKETSDCPLSLLPKDLIKVLRLMIM
jgi:Leucine-rich repeat (LRR) protein